MVQRMRTNRNIQLCDNKKKITHRGRTHIMFYNGPRLGFKIGRNTKAQTGRRQPTPHRTKLILGEWQMDEASKGAEPN